MYTVSVHYADVIQRIHYLPHEHEDMRAALTNAARQGLVASYTYDQPSDWFGWLAWGLCLSGLMGLGAALTW